MPSKCFEVKIGMSESLVWWDTRDTIPHTFSRSFGRVKHTANLARVFVVLLALKLPDVSVQYFLTHVTR